MKRSGVDNQIIHNGKVAPHVEWNETDTDFVRARALEATEQ